MGLRYFIIYTNTLPSIAGRPVHINARTPRTVVTHTVDNPGQVETLTQLVDIASHLDR